MKVNNSSNINKTNSYLWTQKLTMTRDIRNPSLGFEQAPIMWNVAGLNWLKRTPPSQPIFELQHPHPYLNSTIPTHIWTPTSPPLFDLQHPNPYLISNIPTPIWSPTSQPLFELQHPHPYLNSNIPTFIWTPTSSPLFDLQQQFRYKHSIKKVM
jgi:hypothetical protein